MAFHKNIFELEIWLVLQRNEMRRKSSLKEEKKNSNFFCSAADFFPSEKKQKTVSKESSFGNLNGDVWHCKEMLSGPTHHF
jgi:hypothetical protein